MFKKLIGLVLAASVASSASAAIVKYDMKDVIGSQNTTLTGWFYQSTVDSRVLAFGLNFQGPTVGMQFTNDRPAILSARNNFGGNGPTSFRATSNSGSHQQWLDLVFLPGTHQDVVVRGTANRIANDPFDFWIPTNTTHAIQYGTVTSSIVTDEATLNWLANFANFEMAPVISQAIPVEVPEPESAPLLMIAAASAFAASRRRKAA